jgi:ABC-type transport system involved in cytochrome bd biosynthesis fused ATPase/permease subunit
MTKKKLKAIMVLTIAAIILLAALVSTGLIIVLAFPLLILLATILVGWGIKTGVEWLIKNIDYKKVAEKTKERSRIFAEKIKIDEGKKIIKDSIDELRNKK